MLIPVSLLSAVSFVPTCIGARAREALFPPATSGQRPGRRATCKLQLAKQPKINYQFEPASSGLPYFDSPVGPAQTTCLANPVLLARGPASYLARRSFLRLGACLEARFCLVS